MVSHKKINSFALVSVFNKKNIRVLCNALKKNKIGIISTGSTSKKIKSLGFDCFEISSLTNFNEVLGGRVKTLHPKIYISILHNRHNDNHKKTFTKTNFPKIDYVIVNLYPFSRYTNKGDRDAIEMIDIGGPTLLRAAAKNYENVTTISSPADYRLLINNIDKNSGNTDLNFRKRMAKKTFKLTFEYDQSIYGWLSQKNSKKNTIRGLHFQRKNAQAKFITVVQGKILDVVVDLRKNSKTFGNHLSIILSEKNCTSLFIPKGFAHAYYSFEKLNVIYYKISDYYKPGYEDGIIWSDKKFKIKWPNKKPILSLKDKKHGNFDTFEKKYKGL